MDSRDYVNEVLGLNLVYTVIRDWDTCTATAPQSLTGHNVAHFIHDRYGDQFAYNSPNLWRAVAANGVHGSAFAARATAILGLVLAAASLLPRTWEVVVVGPLSTKNIYEQAYQVGHFVRDHYNGKGVVAHDVGALSYYSEPHLVDLFGLGSSEIVRVGRGGESWIDTVNGLVERKDARIAILYEKLHRQAREMIDQDTRPGDLRLQLPDLRHHRGKLLSKGQLALHCQIVEVPLAPLKALLAACNVGNRGLRIAIQSAEKNFRFRQPLRCGEAAFRQIAYLNERCLAQAAL